MKKDILTTMTFAVALLTSVAALGRASSAYACARDQAQFVAAVESVRHDSSLEEGRCLIVLDYSQPGSAFSEDAFCPIDIERTLNPGIIAPCSLKTGEMISGYLVSNDSDQIELE